MNIFYKAAVILWLLVSGIALAAEVPQIEKTRLWQQTNYLASADYGIYELVVNPAKNQVYAAVIDKANKEANRGFINVYDATTLAQLASYKMPYRVFSLAFDAEKQIIYAGHTQSLRISRVDAASGKVLNTSQELHLADKPMHENLRHLAYDPENNNLFVGYINMYKDGQEVKTQLKLLVLDGDSLRLKGEVTGAYPSRGFGLTYDRASKKIYTSGIFINEIDPKTLKVVRTIDATKIQPTTMGLNTLAVDVAGNRIFAGQFSTIGLAPGDKDTDGIYVFELTSGKLIKYIASGSGVQSIAYSPKHKELYITHFLDGTVAVMDTDSYQIKHEYRASYFPNMVTISPDEKMLYVGVKEGFNKQWNPEEFVAGAKERILSFTLE